MVDAAASTRGRGQGSGVHLRPLHEIQAYVLSTARVCLQQSDLHLNDDMWEAGLDSLACVEIAAACEAAGFGTIDPGAFVTARTPAAVADSLRDAPAMRASASVVFHANGSRPPIHFVCPPGGTALSFHGLIDALSLDQPIVVIEPSGMHDPGRLARTIEQAGRDAFDEVTRHQPSGFVILVAYSGGGVTAYECAQLLRAQGRGVHVIMIDCYRLFDEQLRANVITTRARSSSLRPGAVRRLAERLQYAVYNRTARSVPARADRYRLINGMAARARRRYRPQPADFPVTLLHVADSRAARSWGGLVTNVQVIEVSGNHASVLITPHVQQVADLVRQVVSSRPLA